jgi:uncharacterized protein (TIGR03067 family)
MRLQALAVLTLLPLVVGCGSKADKEAILGTWKCVAVETEGKAEPQASNLGMKFIFTPTEVTNVSTRGEQFSQPYKMDASKSPKEIDLMGIASVYTLDGNTLKVYHGQMAGAARPTAYSSPAGAKMVVTTWTRE